MTERGQPEDVALACPFVAFDEERDERSDRPDTRHRCYAESPPSQIALGHQEQFCLSPAFGGCPIFRSWAAREAARVQPSSGPPTATGFAAVLAAAGADRVVPDAPPRHVQQGSWSEPPPWLNATDDPHDTGDDDRLGGLVAPRPAPGSGEPIDPALAAAAAAAVPAFLARPSDRPAGAGLAGSIADESAAAALASRLAAIGMDDPGPSGALPLAGASPTAGSPGIAEVAGAAPVVISAAAVNVDPSAPVRRMASPEDDIIGARVVREPGAGSELSRIIRLGTAAPAPEPRPVSSAGGGRGRGPEPSREQSRKNEAYPTIRTRSRIPRIPRAAIGAIALAAAAAILFFVVPPLFVGNDAGGPGASGAASPGASASARPSRTPARSAAPSPRVYVVRQGDTLSTIAARFDLTVDEVLAANPDIDNPNQIAIGDRIIIPTAASPTPGEEASPSDESATEEPAGT